MTSHYSPLLQEYLEQLRTATSRGAVLDLACGSGRNGLYLLRQGIPVVFGDSSAVALASVERAFDQKLYAGSQHLATLWPVDFEQCPKNPFDGAMFAGILVYRYLHRPLFESIRQAVYPGGIVIYETFTVDQPEFGRPRNPDYLLEPGELRAHFSDWEILHSFEGTVENEGGDSLQAIAQIVARKTC